MKYYFIRKPQIYNCEKFGTSKLGINEFNEDFIYKEDEFWDYGKTIQVGLYGEEQEKKLEFISYQKAGLGYIYIMLSQLKFVLEQFNMPEHYWYKAEAGYDLAFVQRMKKYFKIEYDIDINEKREYWILQILDKKIEELAFELIDFQLNDYDTFTFKSRKYLGVGAIKTYEDYRQVRKTEIQANNSYPEPSVYKYQKNYDILCGGVHIIFNEKVKKALEATNIITPENGLEFVEFTDYEIQMLGE